MLFDELDEQNYLLFAMKFYDNPECQNVEEFYEDLNRTKYLKRLLRRYKSSGTLRERLILNHIIIFFNVFGISAGIRLLKFKIEEDLHPQLNSFFLYLDYITIDQVVDFDEDILAILREI